MDVARHLTYATPSTEIMEASSQRVTTRYVMGSPTLRSKALNPIHVHDDPNIYTGRSVRVRKDNIKGSPSKYVGELKGGLLIRDLCIHCTDSIHDMRVVNTDATSYHSKSPKNCLETTEKAK